MNICIFLDSPLHAPGGTVQSVLNQKTVLEQAGHSVFIVCLGRRTFDDHRIYYARPYICMINDDVNFAYLISNPVTHSRIMRFVRDNEIDVIHVQSESTTSRIGIKIARRLGIPVVATVHNYFWPATGPLQFTGGLIIEAQTLMLTGERLQPSKFGDNRLERAIRGLTETICKKVDAVISPSQHLRAKLQEAGISTPISVLPNPYVELPAVGAQSLLTTQDHATFVWIGRCAPEKRLIEFIEALAYARQRTEKPFRVTIIGDGPDLSQARAAVTRDGLEDIITFTGRLANHDVVEYIDAASMLVLTSYHFDNQPVVVSEAISRYRGVVYCDERISEGVSAAGLCAFDSSPASIGDALLTVIEDPDIARQYSEKARQEAELFKGGTYSTRFVELVRSIGSRDMVQ